MKNMYSMYRANSDQQADLYLCKSHFSEHMFSIMANDQKRTTIITIPCNVTKTLLISSQNKSLHIQIITCEKWQMWIKAGPFKNV